MEATQVVFQERNLTLKSNRQRQLPNQDKNNDRCGLLIFNGKLRIANFSDLFVPQVLTFGRWFWYVNVKDSNV